MRSIILLLVASFALFAFRDCVECRTIATFDSNIIQSLLPLDQESRVIGDHLSRMKRHAIKKMGNGCAINSKRVGPMCISDSRSKYKGRTPKKTKRTG